jgi:hypothetical protein
MSVTPVKDAIGVALLVARAIESVGGSYFVGGSVASSFQGEPRATNDIDIVLELPLGCIGAFIKALGPDFEIDRDMLRDALLQWRSCNIFYLPIVMKVDLSAVGPTPYDEIEFRGDGLWSSTTRATSCHSRRQRTRYCGSFGIAKEVRCRNGSGATFSRFFA